VDENLNDDPYFGINICSSFFDIQSLKAAKYGPLFLSINIQSLMSKHEQLVMEIQEILDNGIQIDALCIQEIWDIRYPELVDIPGFKPIIFKKRRNMRGGGVGIFIRNELNGTIIENLSPFENKIFESITIQLTYPTTNKSVLLTSAYRSNGVLPNVTQSQQMERFLDKFGELTAQIQQTRKDAYILMDANINLLDLGAVASTNYINTMFGNGFLQGVFKATRIQNNSKTLIDHILFNNLRDSVYTGTLISDISDHFFTFVCVGSSLKNTQSHKHTFSRDFSLNNLRVFKDELTIADWTSVYNADAVDIAYDSFWSTYADTFNRVFPLKKKRFNKNIHCKNKFMSRGILTSRQTLKNLHKTAVSFPSPYNIEKYKTYKTAYQRTLRAAKKLHFARTLNDNAADPKKTWQTLNEILGKSKGNSTVSQLKVNGVIERDETAIANSFNNFFTNIGMEISNSVPPVLAQPEDAVNYGRDIPGLRLGNTTPEHILQTIKKFKLKHSCDSQGVSNKMIKFIGQEIAAPLSHIFNLSLRSGVFPNKLKQARVIPIFKSGDHLECDNYRPISLLSSISKILEKIVSEKLIHHLFEHDLLYQHQYGFLPKRSTEQNLMQILNYVTKALNENMFCVGIFLDLRKAFDVCSHEILLKKLEKM
jgi:hypothetical protein